jgi:DNA-binding MarR family transcriptional regulator
MSDIKTIITDQLQRIQIMMHRLSFHGLMADGWTSDPYRGQGRVMSILKLKPEISQKELTYLLGTSKQSLAELLSKLEKRGYITRDQSEEDKRVMNVKLTTEGKSASSTEQETTKSSMDIIFECFNDTELVNFSEFLGRIIDKYEGLFPDEEYGERRKYMERFMSKYQTESDRREPDYGPGRDPIFGDGHGPGQDPGHGPGYGPGQDLGHGPGQRPRHRPGHIRNRPFSFSDNRDQPRNFRDFGNHDHYPDFSQVLPPIDSDPEDDDE